MLFLPCVIRFQFDSEVCVCVRVLNDHALSWCEVLLDIDAF